MGALRTIGRAFNLGVMIAVAVTVGTVCYVGYAAKYQVARWNRWVLDGVRRGRR